MLRAHTPTRLLSRTTMLIATSCWSEDVIVNQNPPHCLATDSKHSVVCLANENPPFFCLDSIHASCEGKNGKIKRQLCRLHILRFRTSNILIGLSRLQCQNFTVMDKRGRKGTEGFRAVNPEKRYVIGI